MRMKGTKASSALGHRLLLLGIGLIPLSVVAEAPSEPPARQPPIEEIEVIGERSLLQLRLEIKQAEVHMFDLFNALNSTDDFDVTCRNVTHTGTLIPTWECDAGYMRRARFQNVQDFLNFGIPPKSEQELWWENRHKTEQLNAEMKAVAREHPELASAMIELHEKRQRLEELEQERLAETKGFFSRLFGRRKQ